MAGEHFLRVVTPDTWAEVVSREHSTYMELDSGVLLGALNVAFPR